MRSAPHRQRPIKEARSNVGNTLRRPWPVPATLGAPILPVVSSFPTSMGGVFSS